MLLKHGLTKFSGDISINVFHKRLNKTKTKIRQRQNHSALQYKVANCTDHLAKFCCW